MNRFLADLFLFLSVFVLPSWLTVVFAVILFFIFDNFFELIVSGFIMDLLYGDKLTGFYGVSYLYFVAAIISFVILGQLKKRMRYA